MGKNTSRFSRHDAQQMHLDEDDNNNNKITDASTTSKTTKGKVNNYDLPPLEVMQKVVEEKLLDNEVYRSRLQSNKPLLERFRNALCVKEDLIKTYLTTDWIETKNLTNEMLQEANKSFKQSSNFKESTVSSTSASNDVGVIIRNDDDDSDEDLDEKFEEAGILNNNQRKQTVKIKFVVAEVSHTKGKKAFRKLISPILSNFDTFPSLGMFHSAVIIGAWKLEWNNSALCVPRKCISNAALLTADLGSIETDESLESLVSKLADVIVKWNTTMSYKDRGGDKSKVGNCQDFVDCVLDAIGVSKDKLSEGPLGEFLKDMREHGLCELVFKMSDSFRHKFNISEKSKKFTTHLELDTFVQELMDIDNDFQKNHGPEYNLLKSFDRAFWLKHLKFTENPDFSPITKEERDDEDQIVHVPNCPFKDPRETYSLFM
ncbi:hypothetical protein ABK040_013383 [Willaertia magna]